MEREDDRVETVLADGLRDHADDTPPADSARHSESLDHADNTLRPKFIRKVAEALDSEDQEQVYNLVEPLHPADIADLFELIGAEYRAPLARAINDLLGSEVLAEMNDWVRDDLVDELDPDEVAELAEQMETDDAVALIEDLDEEDQQAVLAEMEPEDRAAIESALSYPEESAGRLMSRDFIAVPEHLTVGDLIDYLRDDRNLATEFWEVFIVDPKHRPVGTCMLSWILRAPRHVALSDVMKRDQTLIPVTMDQEEVALRFQKYALISAAIVDESGRLVGQITVDDIVHIIQEEAGEDALLLSGAGEGDINEPLPRTIRTRMIWLSINLGTAILASSVVALFEATITRLVTLAVLMPIVTGMGGNAATQTMTVTVRALATNQLTSSNTLRMIAREWWIASANGWGLGLLMAATCQVIYQDWMLSFVLLLAMILNSINAGLSGVLIPLGLDKLKIDPAVTSTVFVTTMTDTFGFFFFLGLAELFALH
ncbi:magnesium transporter [Novosphingobium sp. KCTC 2891]|uniref:magnesium transporter n=1 Tax=Novosphingobium sp. KCTC 2891 TaxID=2989730 RepID=UPI00222373FF|nr:magnesium transporter [Novosphingobium sp. KCTC 2891]MCW1382615.1 magnesium transporter [Novosphingobium sp. KCTC 2891]